MTQNTLETTLYDD